jgi:hypothetical protein
VPTPPRFNFFQTTDISEPHFLASMEFEVTYVGKTLAPPPGDPRGEKAVFTGTKIGRVQKRPRGAGTQIVEWVALPDDRSAVYKTRKEAAEALLIRRLFPKGVGVN